MTDLPTVMTNLSTVHEISTNRDSPYTDLLFIPCKASIVCNTRLSY